MSALELAPTNSVLRAKDSYSGTESLPGSKSSGVPAIFAEARFAADVDVSRESTKTVFEGVKNMEHPLPEAVNLT